jgi:peroxiredoxin
MEPMESASPEIRSDNLQIANSRIKRDGLPAGTTAPIFELPALDGMRHSLDEWLGFRVLLVFTDPDCGPCNDVARKLQAILVSPDFKIVFIARGDAEKNQRKAAALRLTYPILLQKHWEISRLYGIFATPVGYLIDEKGIISANVAVGLDAILSLLDRPTSCESHLRLRVEALTKRIGRA